MAATGTVMPSPYQTVLDTAGHPVSGALVWTYLAGTSTPQATYSEATLAAANTNPIVADSAGRFVAFLAPGSSYKFVYETAAIPPAHGSVLRTVDLVSAIPSAAGNVDITATAGAALAAGDVVYLSDGTGGLTSGRWYKADNANPYTSSTATTVGIVLASVAAGATGTVRTHGTVTGLTVSAGATYYVGSAGGMTTTKPASPAYTRVVGVADTSTSLILSGLAPADQTATVIVDSTTGTPGVWNLPLKANSVIEWNGTADLTVDGLATSAVGPGAVIRIVNISTSAILYLRYFVGSPGPNGPFFNVVASGPTALAPGGSATYMLEGASGWRMLQHEQGGMITPPFNAANFSANAGGSWTVTAGGVTQYAYRVSGQTLTVLATVQGTVGGTPTALFLALPYTIPSGCRATLGAALQMPAFEAGFAQASPGSTQWFVQRMTLAAIPAGTTSIFATLITAIT